MGRGAPRQSTGYFRAQPLDLGFRRRKKVDPFVEDTTMHIDYKDAKLLSRFMSERGRVLPRRMTGLNAANQRQISRAIKRAQHLAILPYRRGA
ncbi:MAG: 30S ribosomal protein S18 [Bdellovibrionales bacterium]|nr:30S ribosomal protein S18 [Bdellovibrionales bacterium]